MERYVLDRIEDGELAVMVHQEGGPSVTIPVRWIFGPLHEGDVIEVAFGADGSVLLTPDPGATRARRDEMEKLRDSIPKGPSGPIQL